MLSQTLTRNFRLESDQVRSSILADAQRPILCVLLLAGVLLFAYFGFVSMLDSSRAHHVLIGLLSLATGAMFFAGRGWLTRRRHVSLGALERMAMAAEALVYFNVIAYLFADFDNCKVFYLLLMPIVFSVASVTTRLTIVSVAISLGTLSIILLLSPESAPPEFLKLATATVAIIVATFLLLRGTVMRQVNARILAQAYEREIERQAGVDLLTGICNRRSVFRRLEDLVARGECAWLGVLDIDGLKAVNETHGHNAGDEVLMAVAARLSTGVCDALTVGRLEGDEFALILTGKRSREMISRDCATIMSAFDAPMRIHGVDMKITASVGLVSYPDMASSVSELYDKADFALLEAKDAGAGIVIFDARQAAEFKANAELERALGEADFATELYLVYQPQVEIATRRPRGFEALVRWNSPTLGSIPPDRFIRAAERIGRIQTLTRAVLRKGLSTLAQWPEEIGMSFNLSAQDASDRTFLTELLEMIAEAGVSAGRVEFEITETAILTDPDAAHQALSVLAEAGCRIALDDFGAGYSSLQHLRKLPLNKVKIDRGFVRDASTSSASLEIVAAVIDLCRRLGLRCVVEGVETEEELALLLPLRPDKIQGYLFGRPMDAAAARAFIDAAPAGGPIVEQL